MAYGITRMATSIFRISNYRGNGASGHRLLATLRPVPVRPDTQSANSKENKLRRAEYFLLLYNLRAGSH